MAWFRPSKRKSPPQQDKKELWVVCGACKAHVYKEEWQNNVKVCPKCNFHDKITYKERLDITVDPGSFQESNAEIVAADPLGFTDASGRYADKMTASAEKTGMLEAVVTGRARINDRQVVIAIMDFRFVGGSLGSGTGEKILLAAEHALKHKLPYIVFSASGGARMQEGTVSLMQMAKTCAGIARLHKAGIPYISVLTNPTYGGVSASFATVGDLNVAEPGALIGFAGRRVIEKTIKQKLPRDFQTAEYLLAHGFLDRIVTRSEMKDFLHNVLGYWHKK